MAITMESCVPSKALGLSRPVLGNNATVQFGRVISSSTTCVKRSIEDLTKDDQERSANPQSLPSKRQRLETAPLPKSFTSQRHQGKDHLTSLPNELFFSIIEKLDNPVDFACLASTCQQVYHTVRQNHINKVRLDKYQKTKYALREELAYPDIVTKPGEPDIWHKAYNELDLELPYTDFVLSWCDAWRVTHNRLSVSKLVPKNIVQHMRMDGKQQKLKWEEEWRAQITSNAQILLHCKRTYPNVRFVDGRIEVNGAPAHDGLFKMCNHQRLSHDEVLRAEKNACFILSRNNNYSMSCRECNTNMTARMVERFNTLGVAIRDMEIKTFHKLGQFEIEDCDNRTWLQWLGKQPVHSTTSAGQSLEEEAEAIAVRRYSIGAEAAWKTNTGKAYIKEQKERMMTFV